ncbi:hypothetical protein C5167_005682 [Papaver somniferum]|uniref:Uncharacterized protein n=1 Tax=Papaver somniferum TaxID=3469 RepID=A0A4Y7JEM7_PAPSO|nr:hypothetical protein C5167_005682 [Papaver somniferum]
MPMKIRMEKKMKTFTEKKMKALTKQKVESPGMMMGKPVIDPTLYGQQPHPYMPPQCGHNHLRNSSSNNNNRQILEDPNLRYKYQLLNFPWFKQPLSAELVGKEMGYCWDQNVQFSKEILALIR